MEMFRQQSWRRKRRWRWRTRRRWRSGKGRSHTSRGSEIHISPFSSPLSSSLSPALLNRKMEVKIRKGAKPYIKGKWTFVFSLSLSFAQNQRQPFSNWKWISFGLCLRLCLNKKTKVKIQQEVKSRESEFHICLCLWFMNQHQRSGRGEANTSRESEFLCQHFSHLLPLINLFHLYLWEVTWMTVSIWRLLFGLKIEPTLTCVRVSHRINLIFTLFRAVQYDSVNSEQIYMQYNNCISGTHFFNFFAFSLNLLKLLWLADAKLTQTQGIFNHPCLLFGNISPAETIRNVSNEAMFNDTEKMRPVYSF